MKAIRRFLRYDNLGWLYVLPALVYMLALTGCERRGICENCQQEEVLSEYICTGGGGRRGDEGKTVYLCDYCRQYYKFMGY